MTPLALMSEEQIVSLSPQKHKFYKQRNCAHWTPGSKPDTDIYFPEMEAFLHQLSEILIEGGAWIQCYNYEKLMVQITFQIA